MEFSNVNRFFIEPSGEIVVEGPLGTKLVTMGHRVRDLETQEIYESEMLLEDAADLALTHDKHHLRS
jgi:hypothetical protein